MLDDVILQSDEAFARELLEKKDQVNIIKEIFDRFSIDCINAHALDSVKLDSAIEQFNETPDNLALLTEIIKSVHASVNSGQQEEQHLALRITEYLNSKYNETKTIYQIAEELNISYYYLSHFVKKHFGMSLTALRNKVRILKAKFALVMTDNSISDIATDCGFENISYFAEVFTKQEGMSPRGYRSQYEDKIYFDFYDDEDMAFANMIDSVRVTDTDVAVVNTDVKVSTVITPDDKYKFLHEAAIIEYHGTLFASWYNCPEKELQGHTPIRGKRSNDGGATWSDVEVVDEQADDGDSIIFCPPVYGICDDKLYMLANEMVAHDRVHALNHHV